MTIFQQNNLTKKDSIAPQVLTFGCRLNVYESSVIEELVKKNSLNNTVVINTCAVTAEAERQARQAIRKIKKERPELSIIVTGCSAQINPKTYSSMKEVNHVIGNKEKMENAIWSSIKENVEDKHVFVNDIFELKETASHLVSGFDGKVRAFIQVQNGCNHRCTFCTIPFGRGDSRSIPIGEIVKQIRHLIQNGYQEFVLTGVDLTAYGEDLPGKPTLGQMIKRTLALIPELQRLRLSSLDPVEIDSDLWKLIETETRILPHFHISLQAGDDMILKRMKRRHLRQDIVNVCHRIYKARPDAAIGADIIAGFPTETEAYFLNTYNIVEECRLVFLHVFPFSPRPNTPANRMPQLPKQLIKERAKKLRTKGQEIFESYMKSFLKKEVTALIETKEEAFLYGKTDHFIPIQIPYKNMERETKVGEIIKCDVTSYTDKHLVGILHEEKKFLV